MNSRIISKLHEEGFHLRFCEILCFLFLITIPGCKKGNYNKENFPLTPFITFTEPANATIKVNKPKYLLSSARQLILQRLPLLILYNKAAL